MTTSKRAAGFTLIELLVVVAIIVVLIAILLPSLGNARKQAKSVVCQSQLRQFAMACRMYADENNNYWVADTTGSSASPVRWWVRLNTYIPRDTGHTGTVAMKCPEFEMLAPPENDTNGLSFYTGYNFNRNLGSRKTTGRILKMTELSGVEVRTPFAWDDLQLGGLLNSPYIGSKPEDWWNPSGGEFYRLGFRHAGNSCNLGMVDGHVETIRYKPVYVGTGGINTAADFKQYKWDPLDDRSGSR